MMQVLALLVTTALLPVQDPQAAVMRHHPKEAFLWIEVPALQQALDEYQQAPLVKLYKDPEVRQTIEGLMEKTGFDLAAQWSELAAQTGLPERFHADPMGQLVTELRGLDSLTMSMSLRAPSAEESARAAQWKEIDHDLEQIEKALEAAHEKSQRYPASLAELGLDEAVQKDPWGNPYALKLQEGEEEGSSMPTVHSHGSDGQAGGFGDAQDIFEYTLFTRWSSQFSARIGMDMHAEFRDEAAAAKANSMLSDLLLKAIERSPTIAAGSDASVTIATFTPEDPTDPVANLASMGKRLHLSVGLGRKDAPERVIKDGYEQALGSAEWLGGRWKNFQPGTGAILARAAMDIERLLAELRPQMAVTRGDWTSWTELGVRKAEVEMRLGAGRFVSQAWVDRDPSVKSFLDWFANVPLPESFWKRVPDDAVAMFASSYDAKAAYAGVMEQLRKGGGESFDRERAEMEEKYGFSLEKDLIGGLGKSASVYLMPITGLQMPGVVMCADVADAAAFQRGLSGVLKLIEAEAGDEVRVQYKPYRASSGTGGPKEVPMWIMNIGQPGGMNPLQPTPTIALVGDQVMITLTSVRAKREIKRILGEGEVTAHALASSERKPPAEATALWYMDWGTLLGGAWTTGKSFMGMAPAGSLPVSAADLPDFAMFAKHFEPSVSWVKRAGPQILSHSESSFGPEVALGFFGLGFGVQAARTQRMQPVTVPAAEPEAQPANANEIEAAAASVQTQARMEETRGALQRVKGRLAVYKLDQGEFPLALDGLSKATPNYPNGFLDGLPLPTDAWGGALRYARAQPGECKLWSAGPNGLDEQGAGDDIALSN